MKNGNHGWSSSGGERKSKGPTSGAGLKRATRSPPKAVLLHLLAAVPTARLSYAHAFCLQSGGTGLGGRSGQLDLIYFILILLIFYLYSIVGRVPREFHRSSIDNPALASLCQSAPYSCIPLYSILLNQLQFTPCLETSFHLLSSSGHQAMTDQDNSYRPQSPDFSTLQSPLSPAVTHPVYPVSSPLAHRASYDASPFFTPQYQPPHAPLAANHQQYIPPFNHPHLDPTDMARRSSRIARAAEVAPGPDPRYVEPLSEEEAPQPPSPVEPVGPIEPIEPDVPDVPEEPEAPVEPVATITNVEVKTKFPVARIKRIMQADEDVGKVAQVTPIAVSKALELFMISLVTKAAKEAKDRNSKRVTASHLKQAVAKDEVLDFLADIIAKVPDQPTGRKHEDDGSDQNEQPKRKRGGRKPKDDSD